MPDLLPSVPVVTSTTTYPLDMTLYNDPGQGIQRVFPAGETVYFYNIQTVTVADNEYQYCRLNDGAVGWVALINSLPENAPIVPPEAVAEPTPEPLAVVEDFTVEPHMEHAEEPPPMLDEQSG
jgi:hypothetical protein